MRVKWHHIHENAWKTWKSLIELYLSSYGILFFPFLINPTHHSKASFNSFWSPERYASCEPPEPTSPGRHWPALMFLLLFPSLPGDPGIPHVSHLHILLILVQGLSSIFPIFHFNFVLILQSCHTHHWSWKPLTTLSSHRIGAFFIHDCFNVNFWSSPYLILVSSFSYLSPFLGSSKT